MTNENESNEDRPPAGRAGIQRALNESKKRELEEKYGADFHSMESSVSRPSQKLPPEIEGQWLSNIEQFEQQFQHAKRTTMREFIGNPDLQLIVEIPPERLEEELDRIVGIMAEHEVILDFCAPTPIEEQYRFITEELLNEEMDEIRIPGLQHRFIYEEFHPNDELDVADAAGDIVYFLLDKKPEMFAHHISKTDFCDAAGNRMTREQVMESINRFYEKILVSSDVEVKNIRSTVDGDTANAEADVAWQGLAMDGVKNFSHEGVAMLRLKRSECGGWDVTQFRVPGFAW